ncbi:hypothetical protein NP590_01455 [Methylomonas sp. SURF-2]|uniref:Uncharacterized protein n=1 Tax=Methylomonas subterranea TaxID=2952225 RepID=A0ABT1TBB7_9GAMM|nr:hypothetical protein [Methylomonas sp. SURF-2]MCQ8102755.1 hypothetical protein [Methylomonas sp. SURF-2]
MQRCPVCNARLNGAPACPRCGAELGRIRRGERLAEQWLSVALQSLSAGQASLAAAAVMRSLSFRQGPEAELLKGFLLRQQYRRFYQGVGRQNWPEAENALDCLRQLRGDSETLLRFTELLAYLSARSSENGAMGE